MAGERSDKTITLTINAGEELELEPESSWSPTYFYEHPYMVYGMRSTGKSVLGPLIKRLLDEESRQPAGASPTAEEHNGAKS